MSPRRTETCLRGGRLTLKAAGAYGQTTPPDVSHMTPIPLARAKTSARLAALPQDALLLFIKTKLCLLFLAGFIKWARCHRDASARISRNGSPDAVLSAPVEEFHSPEKTKGTNQRRRPSVCSLRGKKTGIWSSRATKLFMGGTGNGRDLL